MTLKSEIHPEFGTAGGSKGHQVAINGFIAWLITITAFLMYFLWAFLPGPILDWALMSYYPDKYWAVALPSIVIMSVVYYLSTSLLLILYTTNPLTDGLCIADTSAKEDHDSLESLSDAKESVPPLTDIPVTVSSRVLFQPWN